MDFVVAYHEGDTLYRVPAWLWWRFIFAKPELLPGPPPSWKQEPYQYKCFAGIGLFGKAFGYDFITGRMWREWEDQRRKSLMLPDCGMDEEFDPKKHNSYRRNSKPFTPLMAWRLARY